MTPSWKYHLKKVGKPGQVKLKMTDDTIGGHQVVQKPGKQVQKKTEVFAFQKSKFIFF